MKARRLMAILIAALLALGGGLSFAEDAPATQEQYIKFSENVFSFEIPGTWSRLEDDWLRVFHNTFDESSKQIYRQYYGRAADFEWHAPYLSGFATAGHKAIALTMIMQIPAQKSDYLEQMYKESEDKARWGLKQGRIRKVLDISKVEINGMPALKLDTESANGSRMLSYGFFFPEQPQLVFQVIFMAEAGQYGPHEQAYNHILDTLRISFNKEKAE